MTTAKQAVDHEKAAAAQLRDAVATYETATREAADLRLRHSEAQRARQMFEAEHRNRRREFVEGELDEVSRAHYERLTAQETELHEAMHAAEQRRDETNAQIRELQLAMRVAPEVKPEDLARAQKAVREVAREVERIEALIADQESRLAAVADSTGALAELRASRQALLADVAEGKAGDQEVAELEARIAEAEQTAAAAGALRERLQATLAGLAEKRAAAVRANEAAQEALRAGQVAYVRHAAELAVTDYIEAAEALKKALAKIIGRRNVLRALEGGNSSHARLLTPAVELVIPSLNLPVFAELAHPAHPGILWRAALLDEETAEKDARSKLKALGGLI